MILNNSNIQIQNDTSLSNDSSIYEDYDLSIRTLIFIVLYGVIFAFGVLANLLITILFLFNKKHKSHSNFFFANLSISDLLVLLVCIPVAITDLIDPFQWFYGMIYCKLYYVVEYCVTSLSSLTIIFISLERYMAIFYPLEVG
jgi:hypothetical protein